MNRSRSDIKNKNQITVLILPDRGEKRLTLRISVSHLRAIAALSAILVIAFSAILTDYVRLLPERHKNNDLRSEKRELVSNLQIVSGKANSFQEDLERIKTFSGKLKTITSINQPDRNLVLPMGPLPLANKEIEEKIGENDSDRTPNSVSILDLPLFKEKTIDEVADDLFEAKDETPYSKLNAQLDSLLRLSQVREQEVLTLWEDLQDRSALLSATPSTKPALGRYSSGFGYRLSPYTEKPLMHEGVDIAAPYGSPVRSPAEGTVTFSGYNGGYGKLVVIDHGYGVETRYGHNSQLHVHVGQKVRHGDLISSIGSTGRSTGPHVHYEVRVHGVPVDPMNYILEE